MRLPKRSKTTKSKKSFNLAISSRQQKCLPLQKMHETILRLRFQLLLLLSSLKKKKKKRKIIHIVLTSPRHCGSINNRRQPPPGHSVGRLDSQKPLRLSPTAAKNRRLCSVVGRWKFRGGRNPRRLVLIESNRLVRRSRTICLANPVLSNRESPRFSPSCRRTQTRTATPGVNGRRSCTRRAMLMDSRGSSCDV